MIQLIYFIADWIVAKKVYEFHTCCFYFIRFLIAI